MKHLPTTALLGLALSAGNAFAQSAGLPDGFYINGYVDLSYSTDTTDHQAIAYANLDMGIRPNAGLSGIPLGFSLGIEAFRDDGSTGRAAFYPALTFGLGANGLVSVGIPRSVADAGHGYVPDEIFANSYVLSLSLGPYRRSYFSFINLSSTKVTPYGVRYDGRVGNLSFGASYHHIHDSAGTSGGDNFALAFRYRMDGLGSLPNAALFGSVERFDPSDPTSTNLTEYTLGGEAGNDRITGGVFLHRFLSGGSHINLIEAYGTYHFTDQFSTKLSVLNLDVGGGSNTLYGLGLEYRVYDKAFLTASVVDSSGSDTRYEISAGWRF